MTTGQGLTLSLSDRRDYLHGGDLFDSLCQSFGPTGPASLRLFHLTDAALEPCDAPAKAAEGMAGHFSYEREASRHSVWLRPIPGRRITERSPDSDATLCGHITLTGAGLVATGPGLRTTARAAVVLAVRLLCRKDAAARWNLAEITARFPATAGQRFDLRIDRDMSRFSVVALRIDGMDCGRMTFARTGSR